MSSMLLWKSPHPAPARRNAEGEAPEPFSDWNHIIEPSRQLDTTKFRPMRSDRDRLLVRDETGLSRDCAVCAWLRR